MAEHLDVLVLQRAYLRIPPSRVKLNRPSDAINRCSRWLLRFMERVFRTRAGGGAPRELRPKCLRDFMDPVLIVTLGLRGAVRRFRG